jgi:hypothetical protein
VQPFDVTLYTHGLNSAFPPIRDPPFFPIGIYFSWDNEADDQFAWDTIKAVADRLRKVALAGGQDLEHAFIYPNYALVDTPLEKMYGANVPHLHTIRVGVDGNNLMSLTGGFRF